MWPIRGGSSARAWDAGAGPRRHALRLSPVAGVGDDAVVELPAAGHLRAGRGELGAGAAAAGGDVGAGEPADGADERHGDLGALGRVEHFVLGEAGVGDRESVRAVVDGDEGLLRVGADRLLHPRLRIPAGGRSAAAMTPKCWSALETLVLRPEGKCTRRRWSSAAFSTTVWMSTRATPSMSVTVEVMRSFDGVARSATRGCRRALRAVGTWIR